MSCHRSVQVHCEVMCTDLTGCTRRQNNQQYFVWVLMAAAAENYTPHDFSFVVLTFV